MCDQVNGVDMDSARHDQAVSQLTGLDRFVRLVVQRDTLVPAGSVDRSALGSNSPYAGGLYSSR